MRELSLFTGGGGGVLGSKILGWNTVGYVEWEKYPQKIIAQRIKDKIFDEAPIFGDIRTFVSEGFAERYRGLVDVVTGGFPCQPFSVAGKRKGNEDSRDMWPATLEVIKSIQPPLVFLENVPGLLSAKQVFCGNCGESHWLHRNELCWNNQYFGSRCGVCESPMDAKSNESVHYFGKILRDLAESGYDAKWCVLGADDVGAKHHRKRFWILAVASSERAGLEKYRSSGQEWRESNSLQSAFLRQEDRPGSSEGFDSDGREELYADTKYDGSPALPESGSKGPSILNESKGAIGTSKFEGVDSPGNVAYAGREYGSKGDSGKLGASEGERPHGELHYQPICEGQSGNVVDPNGGDTGHELKDERARCDKVNEPWDSGGFECGNVGREDGQSKENNESGELSDSERERRCSGNARGEYAENAWQQSFSSWEYTVRVASWDIKPVLGRVANGVADRSNRLKAIGNGQVSLTMACAYEILFRDFILQARG